MATIIRKSRYNPPQSQAPSTVPMKQRKKAFFDRSQEYLQTLAEEITHNQTDRLAHLMQFYSSKVANWSAANILGIFLQRPKISRPVTIREAKALGHTIKKGVRCAEILVPCVARAKEEPKQEERQGDDERQNRPAAIERPEGEDSQTGEQEEQELRPRVFFKLVSCVVDLGVDTDGPAILKSEDDADAELVLGAALQYAESCGFSVSTSGNAGELLGGRGNMAGGVAYSSNGTKHIALTSATGSARRLSTLAHEMAHHMLGHVEQGKPDDPAKRAMAETQAEAVGYCVCQHFGVGGEYSAAYLKGWGTNPKDLMDNLRTISKVAREIINGIQRQINIGVDIEEEPEEIVEVDDAEFERSFLGDSVTVWHRKEPDFVAPSEFVESEFCKVAIISDTNPGEAFGLTQHIEERWTTSEDPRVQVLSKSARSTAVGDVFEIGEGEFRAVSPLGFTTIPKAGETVSV